MVLNSYLLFQSSQLREPKVELDEDEEPSDQSRLPKTLVEEDDEGSSQEPLPKVLSGGTASVCDAACPTSTLKVTATTLGGS